MKATAEKSGVSNTEAESEADFDEENQQEVKFSLKREIISWAKTLLVSIVIVGLIITFVGRMMKVEGTSMEPTLHNSDRIITTNIHGDFKHGDIVVIKRKNDTSIVKRVIAVEGDTIDIDFETGSVFLNGMILDEPYINEATLRNVDFSGPATVPTDHVFVMGDNRNHSDDSRNSKIGMVDEKNIFGQVIFRVFPFDKFGKIE